MKIKLIQSNDTCIHKCDNLGHRLHQRAQGGYSFKYPGHLDGNQTHALKAHSLGPDH
jgi:ribosomal protein S11